jgi:flagellar motor switch protein FliM
MEHICLLDIPVHLALAIVDRELGGPAVCQEEVRDLTQIEGKLAARLVHLILAEWCNAWADLFPMRPLLLRHETSGRFLNLSTPETMFLILGLEARIAQTVETIQIALPQTIVEPLVAKLNDDLQNGQKPRAAQPGARPRWNPALNDVRIQVSARWRGLEISARQLATLKPGALLRLRPDTTGRVELSLDAQPKFTGQLGTSGQQLAVKIVETLPA